MIILLENELDGLILEYYLAKGEGMVAKKIDIKVNILDRRKTQEVLEEALSEIIIERINKLPKRERQYVIQEVLKGLEKK